MANYTITLKELIKRGYTIFDDTWTTFIPEHKKELCDKIVRRYWFYEIGSETPDRFKHYLNEQLSRTMPYYNELYKSNLLELLPLYDRYIETTTDADKTINRSLTKAGRRDISQLVDFAKSMQKIYDETNNATGETTSSHSGSWSEKGTDQHTIEETGTLAENTTENVVGKTTTSEESTENMVDSISGTKDTTEHQTGSTSSTRRYSDTPQGTVGPSGIDIDKSFLTNYTADSGSSTADTTGKETIKNDETKDTTGTTSGKEDKTIDTTGKKDSDTTKDTTYNGSYNKDGTSEDSGRGTSKDDLTSQSKTKDFENSSNDTKTNELTADSESEGIGEKDKRKIIMKGFTVSQSELLKQYRSTIINIDEMIIESLNTNFMGLY